MNTTYEPIDIIANLPVEIAQEILIQLSPDDVRSAWNCSLRWRFQMDDDIFWKVKCDRDHFNEFAESVRSEIYNNFIDHYPHYWQGVYMYNRALQYNWKNNIYSTLSPTCKEILRVDKIFMVRYFDDQVLIVSTVLFEVVVIESSTGKILHLLEINNDILSNDIVKHEDFIAIHGLHRLKVWSVKSGHNLINLRFNEGLFIMKIYKNLIAFTNRNDVVHVIDIDTGITLYRSNSVVNLCFHNNMMALGKYNGSVEILNLNFNKIIELKSSNNNDNEKIAKLLMQDDYLVCVSTNVRDERCNVAHIWSIKTWRNVHQIADISDSTGVVFLDENILLYEADNTFCIYNLATGKYLIKIRCKLHPDHTISQVPTIYFLNYKSPTIAVNKNYLFKNTSRTTTGWCLKTGAVMINSDVRCEELAFVTDTKMAFLDGSCQLQILNFECKMEY